MPRYAPRALVVAESHASPRLDTEHSARGPFTLSIDPPHPISLAERVYRARRISTTFGRIYLGIKSHQFIARRIAPPDMDQRWSNFHASSAASIGVLAVELRGMILKACQFMSARSDVLPPEYVEALARLQDRVPAHPFDRICGSVEDAVGAAIEDAFADFEEQPVAAASLAQVHRATLHSGETVAVKIQYPEIAELVHHDLANLRLLFRAVGWVERDLEFMPLFDELGEQVPLELDFEHEANNSEIIAGFFKGRSDLRAPRVDRSRSSRRVLVMEYVEGIKINDLEALRKADIDPNAVMRTVIEAYCEQILTHGFFHADPHPGNLLVEPLEAPSDGGPRPFRIVFLDFGLTKRLPPDFREATVAFGAAMLGGDARAMAEALAELGFETRKGGVEALEEITRIVLRTATLMRDQSFVDPAVVRDAAAELPRLIRDNPIVRVPGHLVLVARVIALLSGLGHTLEARLDMVNTILPYVMGVNSQSSRHDDDQ